MVALGVVELEGVAERLEDLTRDARDIPSLEPRVVLGGYAREHRDLFTAKTLHVTSPSEVRQPDVFGLQSGTTRCEEVANLGAVVHALTLRRHPRANQVPAVHAEADSRPPTSPLIG